MSGTGWVGVVFLHKTGFYSFATVYDGRNIARLFKSTSGTWPNVDWKQDVPFTPTAGQYYEFKVIVQGDTIECYIDNILLVSKVDSNILPAGRAGLFATKIHAHFDDFHLWSMSYLGGKLQYEGKYGMYLPSMPSGTGVFGTVIDASPSFNDGYNYDDLGTVGDEREVPESYIMTSPMPDYTAGDMLDWHYVWIHDGIDYIVWDMGLPVEGVRIYPSQDHGPYPEEFNEYDVYYSDDLTNWKKATQFALYYDAITNVRTHDGVKGYRFASSHQYVKIRPNESYSGARDLEIDAVEKLAFVPPPVGGVWVPVNRTELLAPCIGLASLLTVVAASVVYVKHRKKKQD